MRAEDRRALDRAGAAWQALAARGGAHIEPLWSEIMTARASLAEVCAELEREGFHDGAGLLGLAHQRLTEAHAALAGGPQAAAPFAAIRILAGDIAHEHGRPEAAVRLLVGALEAAPLKDRRLDDLVEADLEQMREMARRRRQHAAQGGAHGRPTPTPAPAAPAARPPTQAQPSPRPNGQSLLVTEERRGAAPWLIGLALGLAILLLLWGVFGGR